MEYRTTHYGMGARHGYNVFTCTFCFRLSEGPPRVLGRSARLTCADCHTTILNLSICWVCGEMIFRGADCVSFGWCFWHRACFGCLLCGSRKLCAGTPDMVSSMLHDHGSEYCGWGAAEEVMEPPLCALCSQNARSIGSIETGYFKGG